RVQVVRADPELVIVRVEGTQKALVEVRRLLHRLVFPRTNHQRGEPRAARRTRQCLCVSHRWIVVWNRQRYARLRSGCLVEYFVWQVDAKLQGDGFNLGFAEPGAVLECEGDHPEK